MYDASAHGMNASGPQGSTASTQSHLLDAGLGARDAPAALVDVGETVPVRGHLQGGRVGGLGEARRNQQSAISNQP